MIVIMYCMYIIQVSHAYNNIYSVSSADEHRFSLDGQSKQYLTINVTSINSRFKSFGKLTVHHHGSEKSLYYIISSLHYTKCKSVRY